MYKLAAALLLLSSPVFAQANDAFKDCPPIGQTAKGDMVYGMDCKGLKPENRAENQPNMPPTNRRIRSFRSRAGHRIQRPLPRPG
jgi:hypothetical protein